VTKRETLNIRGTLVTKSECSRNSSEVKKTYFFIAKINYLKYKLLFKQLKYLRTLTTTQLYCW